MRIMTRVSPTVWDALAKAGGEYVKCVHTIGAPRPLKKPVRLSYFRNVLLKLFPNFRNVLLKLFPNFWNVLLKLDLLGDAMDGVIVLIASEFGIFPSTNSLIR